MPRFAFFSISSPSRHPANQRAYDPESHSYLAEYVRPASWLLRLSFRPARVSDVAAGRGALPDQIASYRWTIQQLAGAFKINIERSRSQFSPQMDVHVPVPATYEVTLVVRLTDGTTESNSRRYRLRDFLIVSIGDSFAAGQGNPDVPAIPSPDQQLLCKATSIAIVARRAQEFIDGFVRAVNKKGLDGAGLLPLVGKYIVAGAGIVNQLSDVVDDLKDYTVEIGRKAVSTLVEGAEAVLGLFGIGDGGEPTTRPAAWQEPLAYRSYRAGASLAAAAIEREDAFGADRATFLSFARTGSEIDRGLLGPRTVDDVLGDSDVPIDSWTANRGQVEEAVDTVRGRQVDVLIVTIGINDLGFSGLVTRAILKASGQKRAERVRGAKNRIATEYPAALDRLKSQIDRRLRPRHVLICAYPVSIFKEIAEGSVDPCGILSTTYVPNPATGLEFEGLDLDRADARDFGEVGRLLNAKISQKAGEFGWTVVDGIEGDFDGHGYCASESYFVSAEESCLNQGDFEGMLHPNAAGHRVTRDRITSALQDRLFAANWLESALHVLMS